jgi:EAL domain-containing protein (putative c-di-GMP-specific phosphodiesterase class I)
VIAEFAENQEIIQTLASLGVDYAQGYGIAQPSRLSKAPVPGS